MRTRRAATLTFVGIEVCSIPFLLFFGRNLWFSVDDWDFITARSAGNVGDLFRPHFEHWVTSPVLIYRALYALFGLHYYWPYQLVAILFHLTVCALLYALMLRIGVNAWVAVAAASVLVFFGAGYENVLVAFQISFLGAILFGLVQLHITYREGPLRTTDALGVLAGLVALTFSGVAIPVLGAVGLIVFVRRGWKVAALQTIPLATAYAIWSVTAPEPADHLRLVTTPWRVLEFSWVAFRSAFGELAPIGLGVLFLVVVLCGFVDRRRLVPVAFAAATVLFVVVAGFGRSGHLIAHATPAEVLSYSRTVGPERGEQSRYLYIIVALLLPALAVGADMLVRRWPKVAVLLPVALVGLAVPANVPRFDRPAPPAFAAAERWRLLAIPHLPTARRLPRGLRPEPVLAPYITVGWLLDNASRLPSPGPITAARAAVLIRSLEGE